MSTSIGTVATGGHVLHRSRSDGDPATACGHSAMLIEVLAETEGESLHSAQRTLTAAGLSPCRLCRRCWPGHGHSAHRRACWKS